MKIIYLVILLGACTQPDLGIEAQDLTGSPTVVATYQTAAAWGAAYTPPGWAPATITVPNVQTGDTIMVYTAWWNSHHSTSPTDSVGSFVSLVDQGNTYVHASPPVWIQSWVEWNATAGTHVITPPGLNGDGGQDGTFYVIHARGLSGQIRITGQQHNSTGKHQTGNSVQLTAPAQSGDLVVAFSCYDDSVDYTSNTLYTNPPVGWTSAGLQSDSMTNVPSEIAWRVATAADNEVVSWTWRDPNVNVTSAIEVAFVPAIVTTPDAPPIDAPRPPPPIDAPRPDAPAPKPDAHCQEVCTLVCQ